MGAFLAWKSRFCDQRAANSPSAKCSTWENAAQTALEKCRGGILRHKRGCGLQVGHPGVRKGVRMYDKRAKQDALDLWFSMPGEMSVDD
ncbi:hypothetical protein P0G11_08565, partial [Adlercreutzia rubneri]|uniref:hypothetical protein n=1 Tax=Adlercreutzia rubneri TaxID=2916441 RepID=UPI0023AFD9B6